ncbi:hypothetical protein [Romboutsia sp.]|uniref:hypothetical protein n=1 Tax=Romboutsia sp. TaxID=1965302 RepID=UPI002CD7B450|nr:hypothetical protein [Romboutsia sp.]HSQ88834.1 hypothetical protein [Romboutsia sp.]
MNINIKSSDVLCCQGTAMYNEDIAGLNPYGVWILDGATGLNNKNLASKDSDAKWYVNWWNNYLHKNIYKELPLKEIMLNGITNIRKEYYSKIGKNKIEKLDTPSSAISIVKFYENKIEYLLLGDCSLHIKIDEKTSIIKDRTLCKLDKLVYDEMEKLPNLQQLSFEQIKSSVISTIISNRLKKNTEDGYWILEFDENAIENAMYGYTTVHKNIKLMLTSDGFSCVSDRYNLINEEELLNQVTNRGISEIYNELRCFEEEDFSTIKFPRFKIKDDSSCIYLDIEFN